MRKREDSRGGRRRYNLTQHGGREESSCLIHASFGSTNPSTHSWSQPLLIWMVCQFGAPEMSSANSFHSGRGESEKVMIAVC